MAPTGATATAQATELNLCHGPTRETLIVFINFYMQNYNLELKKKSILCKTR